MDKIKEEWMLEIHKIKLSLPVNVDDNEVDFEIAYSDHSEDDDGGQGIFTLYLDEKKICSGDYQGNLKEYLQLVLETLP